MIKLFDPARLPPRDKDGYTYHPGLEGDRFQHDQYEEYLDLEKFRAEGLEVHAVSFEYDAPQEMVDRWEEAGEPDCSYWTPSFPNGDGWLLIAIYDTEDGPVALYVRELEKESEA